MRLDEWQKYIDSEFLEGAPKPKQAEETPSVVTLAERNITATVPVEDISAEHDLVPRNVPGQRPPRESSDVEAVPSVPVFGTAVVGDTEIPSFGKYLPAVHPAHEPEEKTKEQPKEEIDKSTEATAVTSVPVVQTQSGPTIPADTSPAAAKTNPPGRPVISRSTSDNQDLDSSGQRTFAALQALEQLYRASLSQHERGSDRDAQHRRALIERLLDPVLTLEETAILLQVCPTTVRRYTNRGMLVCHRRGVERAHEPAGHGRETRHRRFQLSDIVRFLETQKSALDEDRKSERRSGSGAAPTAPSAESDETP